MAAYLDTASLINSSTFQDKVRCAIVFYSRFILGEGSGVSGHEHRAAWAREAYRNPSPGGLLVAIALDDTIQQHLSDATDAQIQSATENVINTVLNF